MTPTFKKLNYKGQKEIVLINAPSSFEAEATVMSQIANINTSDKPHTFEYLIAFLKVQTEVDTIAKKWLALAKDDAIVWLIYPKMSSKKYTCDFNRDTGWEQVGLQGFEGVRAVAIDEDWSAIRFRKVEYIQKMTRTFAMTKEGKEKSTKE
jgi:hypothetical protein